MLFSAPFFLFAEENIGGIFVSTSPFAQNSINRYKEIYSTGFGQKQLFQILNEKENLRLYVREEIQKRNLPSVLEYLPFVESEYSPLAVSKSGAKGMWQFMDNSISGLLKKSEYIDERFDPWISTKAALTKLEENFKLFDDWLLAIAAYNCGTGAMKRILEQSENSDFWFICENGLLRDQSVQYVPKLLAICSIAEKSELLSASGKKYFQDFEYIVTKNQFYLDRISSEINMSPSILRELNPALIKGCTPPENLYTLRVPNGKRISVLYALGKITMPEKTFN